MEDTKRLWTLGQVSKEYGVSIYTLRRVCSKGLIAGVRRNRNRYKVLNAEQAERAATLVKLFDCGLEWRDLKRLVQLERAGKRTVELRKAMLATQKQQLWQEQERIRRSIDYLERRIEILERDKWTSEIPEQNRM